MKLYLSGKITGDEDYEKKFRDAAVYLSFEGYEVCNPAAHGSPALSWLENMKIVLPLMLECDGVALLSDWEHSRGARIEYHLAFNLGMPAKLLGHWKKGV